MIIRIAVAFFIIAGCIEQCFCQNIGELKKKAEKGDAQAQVVLGGKLIIGENIQKDEMAGARWIAKSAEQNNLAGKYCYGVCLTYGIGVSKNPKEAVKLLGATVDSRKPEEVQIVWDAYDQLGKSGYFKSDEAGVETEVKRLVKWTLLAAENGIPKAQCLAAEMFHEGFNIPKDLGKAAKLMRAAAKGGNNTAVALADSYEYDAMNSIQRWMADRKKEKNADEKKKKIQEIQKNRKESEVAELLREIRDQNAELLNLMKESSEQVSSQPQRVYENDDSSDQQRRESQDSADEIRREINQAQMWDAMQSRLHQ